MRKLHLASGTRRDYPSKHKSSGGWYVSDTACDLESVSEANFHCAADDDAFLDELSTRLAKLANDCQTAVEWSPHAELALQNAEDAFMVIRNMCTEAGLTDEDEALNNGNDGAVASNEYEAEQSTTHDLSELAHITTPRKHELPSNSSALEQIGSCNLPLNVSLSNNARTAKEEAIEIEISDLIAYVHEEVETLEQNFSAQMKSQEERYEERERCRQHEIERLHSALTVSQAMTVQLEEEIATVHRSMEAMQSNVADSMRSLHDEMRIQAHNWKAICHELVIEKRDIAKKLAEERGKYASVKEHLSMHGIVGDTAESRQTQVHTKDVAVSTREFGSHHRSSSLMTVGDSKHHAHGRLSCFTSLNFARSHSNSIASDSDDNQTNSSLLAPVTHPAIEDPTIATVTSSTGSLLGTFPSTDPTSSPSYSSASSQSFRRYYLASLKK